MPDSTSKGKAQETLPDGTVARLAEIFGALGDPSRLRILHALLHQEQCVGDLARSLGMSQSAVSHQLRLLRNLRLVKFRREGKVSVYSLDDDHVLSLINQGLAHVQH